jgi:hypothetical protein
MRIILMILLMLPVAWATLDFDEIDEIQSMELVGGTYTVQFWGLNRVFRVAQRNAVVPCLENAFKSQQRVALKLDIQDGLILDCKLAGNPHPGELRH